MEPFNSKHSVDPSESKLRDPITSLPPELFCKTISSLSPFSIAAASAVSRPWRNIILSDSTLHRCIDLSKVESVWDVLKYLDLFSSRCLHRIGSCSLDLSEFWHEDADLLEMDVDIYGKVEAIFETLSWSRETLKEISITLRDINEDEDSGHISASHDALPFLSPVIDTLLEDFPSLEKIKITAPTEITVKAGGELPGSKSFHIQDASRPRVAPDDVAAILSDISPVRLELMKQARAFAGSGLIEFEGGGWMFSRHRDETFKELWLSRPTLESIYINDYYDDDGARGVIWDEVVHCPNVQHFSLGLCGDLEMLQISRDPTKLKINYCALEGSVQRQAVALEGEDVAELVGNELGEFTISLDCSPGFIDSILIHFSDTLKKIDLTEIGDWKAPQSTSASSISFPNLTTLCLVEVEPTILQFFSNANLPKVQNLTSAEYVYETFRDHFDLYFNIISSTKSNLTSLNLWYRFPITDETSSFSSASSRDLCFPALQRLQLSSNIRSVSEIFSKLSYPNLTEIWPASLIESFKASNPKLGLALTAEQLAEEAGKAEI